MDRDRLTLTRGLTLLLSAVIYLAQADSSKAQLLVQQNIADLAGLRLGQPEAIVDSILRARLAVVHHSVSVDSEIDSGSMHVIELAKPYPLLIASGSMGEVTRAESSTLTLRFYRSKLYQISACSDFFSCTGLDTARPTLSSEFVHPFLRVVSSVTGPLVTTKAYERDRLFYVRRSFAIGYLSILLSMAPEHQRLSITILDAVTLESARVKPDSEHAPPRFYLPGGWPGPSRIPDARKSPGVR